ncbi:MAG: phosphate ABC transporter permease PstA [Planctomycetaceae bacterium]
MTRRKTWFQFLFDVSVWLSPLPIAGLFLWLVGDLILRGSGAFWPDAAEVGGNCVVIVFEQIIQFLTAAPERAGRGGGIGPILISTGLILSVCMTVALPIGLGTAIGLSEFLPVNSRFGRLVRRSLDVLAGVPSIVFGLFGNAFFCRFLGLKFSIASGGLTLACMVLPLLIRSAEEGFRAVPDSQRQAAAALGFSRWSTVFRIILPQASLGIAVGLILGTGRALAETAALIFTSGYVDRMPRSLGDSGRSLSIHIYDLSMNVPGGNENAYASALALVASLAVINLGAHQLMTRLLKREVAYA